GIAGINDRGDHRHGAAGRTGGVPSDDARARPGAVRGRRRGADRAAERRPARAPGVTRRLHGRREGSAAGPDAVAAGGGVAMSRSEAALRRASTGVVDGRRASPPPPRVPRAEPKKTAPREEVPVVPAQEPEGERRGEERFRQFNSAYVEKLIVS